MATIRAGSKKILPMTYLTLDFKIQILAELLLKYLDDFKPNGTQAQEPVHLSCLSTCNLFCELQKPLFIPGGNSPTVNQMKKSNLKWIRQSSCMKHLP